MMDSKRQLKRASFLVLGFCCFLFSSRLSLADYPVSLNKYVNDYASVLTPGDKEAVGKMLERLEYQTGIQATVVTVKSVIPYHTGDTDIEPFATHLFNAWGIGDKNKNNGILILLSVDDRACRIELGQGYPAYYNGLMQDVIQQNMLPYFKNGEYSRGVFEGTRAVIEKVTKKVSWFEFYKWHLLIGVLILVCIFAGISCMRSGKKGWGWAFFAAAGALLLLLIKLLASGKKTSGYGGGRSSGGGATGRW